ncbi:MAG: acyltransferase [Betaproteobacteria bacterium]
MTALIPAPVRGVFAMTWLIANTMFWCSLLFLVALAKLVFPFAGVRRRIDPVLNAIATSWIACNGALLWRRRTTAWDVQGVDELRAGDWYMVTSNHQSWVDIFVLQRLLSRRIPMLKFFLKQQLVYVPVIGLAWWALDFPFMRRHGKAALREHPELRLQDREATRRACEKFALVPTSVMTFPEGTRFTDAKRLAQASPYRHLLKPKAGSLAMALNAMGEQFHSLLDVTIVYPDGTPTFWDFLCGRCRRVVVRVRQLAIAPELRSGDYTADTAFRRRFHQWLDAVWQDKDDEVDRLLRTAPAPLASDERGR